MSSKDTAHEMSNALKLGELLLKNFNVVILNVLPGTNRLINFF